MGVRGAETSKVMFPRALGVLLHNAASFKTIFEKFQTNHKHDAKIDPQKIETSIN